MRRSNHSGAYVISKRVLVIFLSGLICFSFFPVVLLCAGNPDDFSSGSSTVTLQPARVQTQPVQKTVIPSLNASWLGGSSTQKFFLQSPISKNSSQNFIQPDGSVWVVNYMDDGQTLSDAKLWKGTTLFAQAQRKGADGGYRVTDHRNGLVYENVDLASIESLTAIVNASEKFAEQFKGFYMRVMVYVSAQYRISLSDASRLVGWKKLEKVSSANDLNVQGDLDYAFEFFKPDGNRVLFTIRRTGDPENGDFYGESPEGKTIDFRSPMKFDLGNGNSEEHFFSSDGRYTAFAKIKPDGSRKVYDPVTRRLLGETVKGAMTWYVGYSNKGFWRLNDAIGLAKDGDVIVISPSAKYIKGSFSTLKKITIKGASCKSTLSLVPGEQSWICGGKP